jgi:putative ABC transport system permease protein
MLNDVRYGLRALRHNPGFTLAAVLALALGIGANTAIFSVADAFLLKPMPLPQIDRLVMLFEQHSSQSADWNSDHVAPANYLDWTRQAKSFERMAAFEYVDFNLTGQGDPERVLGAMVSGDFFTALGEKPLLGRTFVPEEDRPGSGQVAVLSYGLWQRLYGADPGVLGKIIHIDSKNYAAIGVMPKDFHFPVAAELWTPLAMDAQEQAIRSKYYLKVVGRLKTGVPMEQARSEMQTIARRLADAYPQTNSGWSVRMVPVRKYFSGELTFRYTVMLMCAVGFVLLIACANVANLQFARAASRQKEIAVRTAMGASRWRVVRQLLTESVLLGLGGAALGLLLGQWSLDLILANMPPEVARFVGGWDQIRLDGRTFVFTVMIALLAGIVSGLAPAFVSSKPDLNATLKEGTRGSSAGGARARLRNVLLVGEVALALILLVGAGLMVKGVRALLHVNQNFTPKSLLTMRLALPESKYKERRQIAHLYDRALSALQAIPGVGAAALATNLPYGDGNSLGVLLIDGRPDPAPGELRMALVENVSPNYFRAMHVALRQGRGLNDGDGPDSQRVAIIGEALARHYFPGEDPLGKRIRLNNTDPWMTIVGVAEDIRYSWIDRDPQPAVYRPYRQTSSPYTYLAVRASGDPMRLVPAIRLQMATLDAELPVSEIKTLDRVISESVLGLSYVAVMMTVLGVIAVVLACVGVYGVMSYTVSERTREIGIRIALGAEWTDVLRAVIARSMLVTAAGMAMGFVVSVLLARVLASLIFGVSATDWQTFGGISLALAASALFASYVPARRATRVDPVIALRYE